jgi:hypothetical protein
MLVVLPTPLLNLINYNLARVMFYLFAGHQSPDEILTPLECPLL